MLVQVHFHVLNVQSPQAPSVNFAWNQLLLVSSFYDRWECFSFVYVEWNSHPKKMMLNVCFVNVYNTMAVSFSGSIRFRIFGFFSFVCALQVATTTPTRTCTQDPFTSSTWNITTISLCRAVWWAVKALPSCTSRHTHIWITTARENSSSSFDLYFFKE